MKRITMSGKALMVGTDMDDRQVLLDIAVDRARMRVPLTAQEAEDLAGYLLGAVAIVRENTPE